MHRTEKQTSRVSILLVFPLLLTLSASSALGQVSSNNESVRRWPELDSQGVAASVDHQTLWLELDSSAIKRGKISIARLCAPIRSFEWLGGTVDGLKFVPEPEHWVFSWKSADVERAKIKVEFDVEPRLLSALPPVEPAGDGSIMLHAYQAKTTGEKLRFEPQWYKNTVGYWTIPTDDATWKLSVEQPGTFSVALLQGCGKGQGGSDALITVGKQDQVEAKLDFQTIDTGHFQNFRWNHLGKITIASPGEYELKLAPKKIASKALFDVRMIHLVRQAKAD